MKNILVIGAGFAGISAAEVFSRQKECRVTLIDRKKSFDFLPALPDCLGRGIEPENLAFPISDLSKRLKLDFINEEVIAINLENNEVLSATGKFGFDYLLIASGSEPNFFGNFQIKRYAYKLNNAEDARGIFAALERNAFDDFIISGGGYTGIEVATNLRVYLENKSQNKRIIIVEKAPDILGPLPQWMKEYARQNLERLQIEVCINTAVDKIEGNKVLLSNGQSFNNAMLIWASGVKTSDFIQNLNVDKSPQGRIKVDEYLRIKENCFVAGDAAMILYKNVPLRMAVQFSIFQARYAAKNILLSIKAKQLLKYQPLDLGYIIPMANNHSCGVVCGLKVKGALATFFHYIMCIYRSYGFRHKFGLVSNLLKGGAR